MTEGLVCVEELFCVEGVVWTLGTVLRTGMSAFGDSMAMSFFRFFRKLNTSDFKIKGPCVAEPLRWRVGPVPLIFFGSS